MAKVKVYEYSVVGKGHFPIDMLRYDSAWPARSEDCMPILLSPDRESYREVRTVKVRSHTPPTIDRWRSFMWNVQNLSMWTV
jgi:hypothetical protein